VIGPDATIRLRRILTNLFGHQALHARQAVGKRFGVVEGERIEEIPLWTATPDPSDAHRINLLIPTLEPEHRFGGMSSALAVFESLARGGIDSRVLVTGVGRTRRTEVPQWADAAGSVVFPEGNELRVPLAGGDRFVATTWGTAHAAARMRAWQGREFGEAVRPLVYLVQDYEPAFHPWSTRWLLAEETYREPDTVALFNTSALRDFFAARGYRFSREHSFEPVMNAALVRHHAAITDLRPPKERRILVYGRPSTPRNAFSLVVAGLRLWTEAYPRAGEWMVESAGESHPSVPLFGGMELRSLGKLSLSQYAERLQRAGVGVSWMASPHPSYPPLEMAHFGALTLSNRFEGRDPAWWHENLVAPERNTPEAIAASLTGLCERVEADPRAGWTGRSRLAGYLEPALDLPFAAALLDELFPDPA
jgi:O-antigen biosynthesis protein